MVLYNACMNTERYSPSWSDATLAYILPSSCSCEVGTMLSIKLCFLFSADVPEKDPPDVLNRKKCLDNLAALRHAKWFQVKLNKPNDLLIPYLLSALLKCTLRNVFTIQIGSFLKAWIEMLTKKSRFLEINAPFWQGFWFLFSKGSCKWITVLCYNHSGPERFMSACSHLGVAAQLGKSFFSCLVVLSLNILTFG